VLGLGVEGHFVQHILTSLGAGEVTARIIETPRNGPVRNLYRDNGFTLGDDAIWRRTLA
jgi:hypothetical protein